MGKLNYFKRRIKRYAIHLGLLDNSLLLDINSLFLSIKRRRKLKLSKFSPSSIQFYLTYRCNLNCNCCHQKNLRENEIKELSYKEIKRIIDTIAKSNIQKIDFTGGEIFVRKDVFQILDYVEKKQIKFSISTNGTLIDEGNVNRLKNYKYLIEIRFSLHGPPKVHNKLVNGKNAYDKVINAIKLIGNNQFIIGINCTLENENIKNIGYILSIANFFKIDDVKFTLEMSYSNKEINLSKKLMAIENRIYHNIREESDYMINILHYFKELKNKRRELGVFAFLNPIFLRTHTKDFIDGNIRKLSLKLCCSYFFKVIIDPGGNILLCPYIRQSFGNLLNQSLDEIIKSSEVQEFRSRLLANNMLPICSKCCALQKL